MALTFVEYLLLDGQRYAVPADSSGVSAFKRHYQPIEPSQLAGLRVQSPFLDAETQGFEDGEGLRTINDVATGYYSGQGVEPNDEVPTSGHLRLKVGRQITQEATQASAGGFRAMVVFTNLLYLASASQGKLYTWDGTTLTAVDYSATINSPATAFQPTADVAGRLYFTTMSGGLYVQTVPGTFAAASVPTTTATNGAFLAGVWYNLDASDDLYWFTSEISGEGALFAYNQGAGTRTTIHSVPNKCMIAPAILAGTVYYWLYDAVSTKQPSAELFSHTASAVTGAPSAVGVQVIDNYPVSVCNYRGELYYGMAWGGSVRKLNGSALEEILHVGTTVPPATVPGTDAIYAMTVYGDSLYVAGYDAAAASGQRTWLRRYNGTGWFTVSTGGDDLSTAIRALGAFEQTIVLGDQEATNARLYHLDTALRLTSALMETPDAVYGATGTLKRYRRTTLQHDALIVGQAVEARYLLDGGAEVSLGTNKDAGSTESAFDLPVGVRGTRLRTRWYFTNVSGSDLIVASSSVRALPAPPSLEVWETTLQLSSDAYSNKWSDATADSEDVLTKFERLRTIQQTGQVFQAVDQFRDGTDVKRAMLAVFDPQVPLEWTMRAGGTFDLEVPVRLLQAGQPFNLVKNASFGQDGNAAVPTDWGTVIGSGTSAITDNGAAADGTYSLKVIFSGSASYGRSQSVSGLIPGRYYTISAYIRRTTWATALANPQVDVNEAGILTTGNSCGPGAGAATDAAFVRYSKTFLYPLTGSGTVLVRAFANGTPANLSTVLFDAIQLEEGAPSSTFRELGSGG